MDFGEHVAERAEMVVAHRDETSPVVPLVERVVVHSDDLEHAGIAAELGCEPARQHVEGLVLSLAIALRGLVLRVVLPLRAYVDGRLAEGDARARVRRTDSSRTGERRADELALQLAAPAFGSRIELGDVSAGPCPE